MIVSERLSALFAGVADGDRAAAADLYRLTAPRLFGIALRIARERTVAADALRAAYLDAFARAGEIARQDERQPDPLAVLVACVRRETLDRVRARSPLAHALEPFESDPDVEDPLAAGERSAAFQALLACLGRLSEERRRLVLHAYYDGWSRETLSVYFDAPPHAVNTWVWRSIAEIDASLAS